MLQLWNSLGADGQAAAIGFLLAVLFYLGRVAFPAWFSDPSNTAKFRRTAAAVIGALVLTLGNMAQAGWKGVVSFLVAWALAYAVAEGSHTVVSRTAARKEA